MLYNIVGNTILNLNVLPTKCKQNIHIIIDNSTGNVIIAI